MKTNDIFVTWQELLAEVMHDPQAASLYSGMMQAQAMIAQTMIASYGNQYASGPKTTSALHESGQSSLVRLNARIEDVEQRLSKLEHSRKRQAPKPAQRA